MPVEKTAISWTDSTWSPVTGCSHVSRGCEFCYAETLSLRFGWSKKSWTAVNASENVVLHPDRLRIPYKWREPRRIFVNSMSDMFHEQIPEEFLRECFKVMNDLPQHRFQILTKRPERAVLWGGPWSDNIWMGATVEEERWLGRINDIRNCGAKVKFLSCEPLLTALPNIDLTGIDWVIAGGESGLHMNAPENADRWMKMQWARDLRDACVAQGVAYFYKQSSGMRTEMNPWLVEPDGSKWRWHQFPDDMADPVRVR